LNLNHDSPTKASHWCINWTNPGFRSNRERGMDSFMISLPITRKILRHGNEKLACLK